LAAVVKTKASIAAELTWPQVHAFRLQRHHLSRRAPNKDLAKVVGEMCGAQAQVMSAAELQIAIRVDCAVDHVRKALWTDRTLVKTWLMRGTLHLTRSEDLPLYTAAMRTRWTRVNKSWLKFMQVTEPELGKVVDDIGEALNGNPLTREELIDLVGNGRSQRIREILKSGWGGMLKPAARSGRLCFGPNRGQSVTFVRPQEWLGSWTDVDPDQALIEVARRYLRAYGPATRSDFTRWWGNWPGAGNAAWSGLAQDLVQVSVEGARLDILASELDAVRKAKIDEPVQLLPSFDPYILGHATRDHLFERIHAPKVSRTAGWISAVVLVDGSVAGTWTHALANKTLKVNVAPFGRLTSTVKAQIQERVDTIAESLGATKNEVKVA
jgi:hypothetical protein